MRKFVLALMLIFSLVLQLTVFNYIKVAGVKPDLVLVIIIFNALINGSKDGAVLGVAGGLLQDFVTGQFIGLNTLSKAATGYIFGFAGKKLYRENIFIPIISLLLGSVFNDLVVYFFGYFVKLNIPFLKALYDIIIPTAIYNSCLAPLLYAKFYNSSAKGLLRKVER